MVGKTNGEELFFTLLFTLILLTYPISAYFTGISNNTVKMTAIEIKEEISDTDSGIILHSGKNTAPKSASHLIKSVSTL